MAELNESEKKIKILITAGALGMGGLENQLVYLGKHIDKTKYQVDYTSTDEMAYYKNEIINAGCGFFVIPDPRKDGTLSYCKALLRLLKKGQYDVVHSQELFHSGIEMFLAWRAGVPKRIAHSHSTQDGSNHNNIIKKIYHYIMRKSILFFATDYLACSTIAGEFIYGKAIVNNKNFHVIVNSVETKKFFKEERTKIIEKKDGWKYITHVGRFVDVKNHKFMLDLAANFKRKGKKFAFIFVGNGELYDECMNRVKREHLEDYVVFMGQRKDVADILLDSDIFVLPSFYEGMPLSVIEAQAAGLPCVIADHVTKEVDFELGLIHRGKLSDSINKWTEIIEDAILQPHPDRNRILEAIHKKGFDVSDFQRNLCNIYRK